MTGTIHIPDIRLKAGDIEATIEIEGLTAGFEYTADFIHMGETEIGSEEEDCEYLYSGTMDFVIKFHSKDEMMTALNALQGTSVYYMVDYSKNVKLMIDSSVMKCNYYLKHGEIPFDTDSMVIQLTFRDPIMNLEEDLGSASSAGFYTVEEMISYLLYGDETYKTVNFLTAVRGSFNNVLSQPAISNALLLTDTVKFSASYVVSGGFSKAYSSNSDALKALMNSLCSTLIIDKFDNIYVVPKYDGYLSAETREIKETDIVDESFELSFRGPKYDKVKLNVPYYSSGSRQNYDFDIGNKHKKNSLSAALMFQFGEYSPGYTDVAPWVKVGNDVYLPVIGSLQYAYSGNTPEWRSCDSSGQRFRNAVFGQLKLPAIKIKTDVFGVDWDFIRYYTSRRVPGKKFRLLYAKYNHIKNKTSLILTEVRYDLDSMTLP